MLAIMKVSGILLLGLFPVSASFSPHNAINSVSVSARPRPRPRPHPPRIRTNDDDDPTATRRSASSPPHRRRHRPGQTTTASRAAAAAEEISTEDGDGSSSATTTDDDDDDRPPADTTGGGPAFALQTPHSGRHFRPSHPSCRPRTAAGRTASRLLDPFRFLWSRNRRFTEGWYYRLTLPECGESFVFIFSIEDPGHSPRSDLSLACMQVMGPGDEYLVQADRDDSKLWAWRDSQGFGCTFEWKDVGEKGDHTMTAAMAPAEWRRKVASGFQILPTSIQGRLIGHDGTGGGVLDGMGVPGECDFDLTITPLAGWGDAASSSSRGIGDGGDVGRQLSTAGWLASLPVFEPHWQITLAHARASGSVTWKGRTYSVADQPFYAEKNWGGAFPTKWYWVQCNSFVGHPDLSVTAGGGVRKLPLLGGREESLGLVGIHHDGMFYEAVPWTGDTEWRVEPWGKWELRGRCTDANGGGAASGMFEAELIATCDEPGVLLRAPTKDEGMQYFARDSFYADVNLTLWALERDPETEELVRIEPPIVDDAFSSQGGVEVGGGPWWDVWSGKSSMQQPMKFMVRFPYIFRRFRHRLGQILSRKARD